MNLINSLLRLYIIIYIIYIIYNTWHAQIFNVLYFWNEIGYANILIEYTTIIHMLFVKNYAIKILKMLRISCDLRY